MIVNENSKRLLVEGLMELGITASDEQINKLFKFYELLIEKNKVMNLTGITEIDEVIVKHFIDSVAIVKAIDTDFNKKIKVIDIGTGAGFPGIPLKIIFPELDITLLDSLNKRLLFLNDVIEQLDLHNIKTIHGRSEDIANKIDYREQYDLCVSRAVANLSTLSELCIPFVKVNGRFVSYKASDSDEEIKKAEFAVDKLGAKVEKISKITLPMSDLERVFVDIVKEKNTPKKYPRKAGTPAKEPLSKN